MKKEEENEEKEEEDGEEWRYTERMKEQKENKMEKENCKNRVLPVSLARNSMHKPFDQQLQWNFTFWENKSLSINRKIET